MSNLIKDLVSDTGCETDGNNNSNNPLSTIFHNFIDTQKNKKFVNELKLDKSIKISPMDQEKIINRSHVLQKQFFPEQTDDFLNGQMNDLMNSLSMKNLKKSNGNNYTGTISNINNQSNLIDNIENESDIYNTESLINKMGLNMNALDSGVSLI